MISSYKKYWLHYAKFEGTSSRSDFWWVVLCNFLISLPFWFYAIYALFDAILSYSGPEYIEYMSEAEATAFAFKLLSSIASVAIISLVWWLATLIPNLALEVRRYRDAGLSWAFIFLNLGAFLLAYIPVIGLLLSIACQVTRLVLLVQPSKAVQEVRAEPAFVQPQQEIQEAAPVKAEPQEAVTAQEAESVQGEVQASEANQVPETGQAEVQASETGQAEAIDPDSFESAISDDKTED